MQLQFPDLINPLESIWLCGRVSFQSHPEMREHFTKRDTEYAVRLEDGDNPRYLRLLLGMESDDTGHIHFDCVRAVQFQRRLPKVDSDLEVIQEKCDFLNTLSIRAIINSRFVLAPSEVPEKSPISLLSGIEMNMEGYGAAVTGATVRVADPYKTEVRWKTFRRQESRLFGFEIFRTAEIVLSGTCLVEAERIGRDGFDRNVLGRRSQEKEGVQ